MKNILGNNIRFLRVSNGFTLEWTAEKLGLNGKSSIHGYEVGFASPKIDTLIKMSQLFEISIDTLIKKDLSKGEIGWEIELIKRIEKIESKIK